MRSIFLFLCACSFLGSPVAFAQQGEVYGGYSYVDIDTNGLAARQNANGWEASASWRLWKGLAAEGDFSGYYKTYNSAAILPAAPTITVSVSDYFYGGGPRFNFRPIFVHALVGNDHLTASVAGASASQDGFAVVAGGGVEVPVGHNISVRSTFDYALTRHNIFGGPSYSQNNLRVGLGVAFAFGTWRTSTVAKPNPPGIAIPILGIRADHPESGGARILAVIPGGVGERVGLRVGDIIDQVNGTLIHDPDELATALAKLASGSVQLGFLVQGGWQTEIRVPLGATP